MDRKYDLGTERNYRGPIAKALYTWTPTGKLAVAMSLSRDVDPAQDIQTSFVLITGTYVRPRWNITDKITLQANAEYNIWDYRGEPILGGGARHRVRLIGASLAYRPTKRILLRVQIEDAISADEIFSTLMGDDVEARRGFIQQNASDVRFLDI